MVTSAAATSDAATKKSSSNTGGIVGGVVGGLVALFAIGILLFWWRRRKSRPEAIRSVDSTSYYGRFEMESQPGPVSFMQEASGECIQELEVTETPQEVEGEPSKTRSAESYDKTDREKVKDGADSADPLVELEG